MRKILLATTALVGLVAGSAAHAATSPLTVNIGGSTDFLAGTWTSSNRGDTGSTESNHRDFETLYNLDFGIQGKSGNGVEYGGTLNLTNTPDISNFFRGSTDTPYLSTADIFMSGAFGKVVLGDSHGATDLAVDAPTVGEGQVLGRYIDFLDFTTFAKGFVTGIDGTDHSTNITYFTPKVGNEDNKVQLGVSYVPQFYNFGSSVTNYNNGASTSASGTGTNTNSPYHDVVKGAVAYTGNIAPVALKASAQVLNGTSNKTITGTSTDNWMLNAPTGNVQNFTAWGVGAQAGLEGFTLGGAYLDQGHYDTVTTQNKKQDQFSAGLKYEFSKIGVGVSYLGAKGYANTLATTNPAGTTGDNVNYIKDFTSFGAGGVYTWAPGLTSNLDGVYFNQKSDTAVENKGYVLLVSQKLAF